MLSIWDCWLSVDLQNGPMGTSESAFFPLHEYIEKEFIDVSV